jgi:NADH:ubiquinone oxidoreductase subunit 6 (subunit J)
MSLRRYLIMPIVIAAVGVAYWYFTTPHEWIGFVMLIVFAGAMAVMGWVLVPTLDNVGPTAPVDPDFEPPRRHLG